MITIDYDFDDLALFVDHFGREFIPVTGKAVVVVTGPTSWHVVHFVCVTDGSACCIDMGHKMHGIIDTAFRRVYESDVQIAVEAEWEDRHSDRQHDERADA